MKKLLLLLFLFRCCFCTAQGTDTVAVKATAYFNELRAATQDQKIWPLPVYGPMLLVNTKTHVAYANEPDSAGQFISVAGIYKGQLPASMIIGNSAIEWKGKTWSTVMWPPPENKDGRLNLLAHESFHRIQKRLGLPMRSPTVDFLGTMNGRIYFLLEMQALKAALAKPVDERKADLSNALAFNEKLHELFPKTFESERLLEMNEGLAEYTGVMLGRPVNTIPAHLNQVIDSAENQKSLIRSEAYLTGSVYGYLLYQKSPDWTMRVDSNSSFPALIQHYYHVKPADINQLKQIEKQYGYDAIVAIEKQKEEKRLQLEKNYIQLFTKKTVLSLTLVHMNVGFDPRNLFDLGPYGTVYPTAQIKDDWGALEVSGTGMLMKDWHVVTLSAIGIQSSGSAINGDGWKITLNPGWKLVKQDDLHFVLEQ